MRCHLILEKCELNYSFGLHLSFCGHHVNILVVSSCLCLRNNLNRLLGSTNINSKNLHETLNGNH